MPIQDLHKEACRLRAGTGAEPGRLYFCFAADQDHKAHYSGGENYHVWLPNAAADFPIEGYYEIEQHFVAYLRASCASGGFCGQAEPWFDGERGGQRIAPPELAVIRSLAEGLEPI